MSLEIERIIALLTCANVYIQDNQTKFNLEPIITHYCYGMEFIDYVPDCKRNPKRVIASAAIKWFEHLQHEQPQRVRLHFRPSVRIDIPKGIIDEIIMCGSNWLVENQYNTLNRLYLPLVDPRERGISPPSKSYFALFEGATKILDDISPSVNESRKILDQLLVRLSNFTGKFEHFKYWTDRFDLSRRILKGVEPLESDNFVPSGIYSKEAHQLLRAVLCSWVFGEMSSWHNLAFDEEYCIQHSMFSGKLYEAICNSICSVINSYP